MNINEYENEYKARDSVGTIAIALVTVIILFIMIYCGTRHDEKESVQIDYITSLQDNTGVYATRVYGVGANGAGMTYFSYPIRTEDGGYRIKNVSAKDTTIYYDDTPRVEYHKIIDNGWDVIKEWQLIYIPEGSIIEDYNIDMK